MILGCNLEVLVVTKTIRYKAAIKIILFSKKYKYKYEDKIEWHTLEILTKNVIDFQPM